MAHFYFQNTPHGKRKDGTKINTKLHYDYICRESKYNQMRNREEDLVFTTSGNMPEWADNPGDFWQTAEDERRKNGRAYREFRIGLQEEFSYAENLELVEKFIQETGIKDNHAYSYAIHDKAATFDKSHQNIHCHLMINERIIEKDRPLSADKFFKRYSENQLGEPTQGYRTTDYFEKKETTVELRKKWADIVNEKFIEKGMDQRVSEKSLKAQREELLLEGREEEAELLNREPAPHLGSAYRNPDTMQIIKEKIDESFNAAANSDNVDNIQNQEEQKNSGIENMSKLEQNILIFANDAAIRKIAREIQKERESLRKEQEHEVAKYEAEKIANEPMIVTLESIYDYANEQIIDSKDKMDKSLDDYKKMKAAIITDKQIKAMAKDRLIGGQYIKTVKEYIAISQKLKTAKTKALTNPASASTIYDLTIQKTQLGKQLQTYKVAINKEPEKLNQAIKDLQQENMQKDQEVKRLYAEYAKAKKTNDKYTTVIEKLKDKDLDQIIFSEKVPANLNRNCKIDGETPIAKMEMVVHEGASYAIIKNQAEIYKNENNEICNKFEAVKIGDAINKGKVQVYELTVTKNKNKITNWKVVSVKPKTIDKAGKQVEKTAYLYKRRRQKKTKDIIRKRDHQIVEAAKKEQQFKAQDIVEKASNKIFDDQTHQLNGRWYEEEQNKKSKEQRAEEKIYNDWSL